MKPYTFSVLNAFYIGFSFFILFAAYNPTEAYMTRLYPKVGFIALGIIYFSFCVFSNISSPIIARFGPRACMIAGSIPYALFIASNLLSIEYLTYAAALLIGLGAALLWPAQGAYMARLGNYSLQGDAAAGAGEKGPKKTNMGLLSGIFFLLNGFCNIVGFLITNFLAITPTVLVTVMSAISAVGILSMCFMRFVPPIEPKKDDVQTHAEPERRGVLGCLGGYFAPLVRLMINPDMLLFQLTFIFYGCFYSFFAGAVPPLITTAAYVSPCLICRGVANMICSVLLGKAGDRWGRFGAMFVTYLMAAGAVVCVLAVVLAGPQLEWLFFAAFSLFGAVEGSQPVLIYAISEEQWSGRSEAFALWCMVRSFVCGLFFILGGSVGAVQLGIVVGVMMALGFVGLLVMWVRIRRAARGAHAYQALPEEPVISTGSSPIDGLAAADPVASPLGGAEEAYSKQV
ncbi:putative major facilitator superfamily protein [Paratrimastix pyriformis]|uniref:UNC93-like protein MFSD11 n=1 Tax=Paratrimastix pyriformis TaxID=342808 RepID=A0ABQ8UU54_9EUKA|nr:putative major facilitator superfamily protein [Paratrimastix pyriformis]